MTLKLDKKRTLYIGFAFFTILMLWQVYNFYCPLFLKELFTQNFGEKDYNSIIGVVMALDNILALFMLPLFGSLSDKTKSRFGKRIPYVFIGTIISLLAFPFIALLYIKNSLLGVMIMMALILIAMNVYRAPSVALMPDVTPKPLRAKANAIINFIGYIGAIIGGGLTIFFTKRQENSDLLMRNITIWPFIIVSLFMIFALVILLLKIKENKIVEKMQEEIELGEILSESNEKIEKGKPLCKKDKKNLWILIFSVFLWYFAFNAVETFGSTYGLNILKTTSWGLATNVLAIASLITFLPSSKLTDKIGRKNSIIVGLGLMIISLFIATFITSFNIWLIILMALAGVGWAIINVNSYPMFVELASTKNIGKFTGYYYTASQVAQSITPIAIGIVLDTLGLRSYFPYATIFMIIALLVFMWVKPKRVRKNTEDDQNSDIYKTTHKENHDLTEVQK